MRCASARARACRAARRRRSGATASPRRPRRSRAPRAAAGPRQAARRPNSSTGQLRSRRDAAQRAVRVDGDRVPDGLEERKVGVAVGVGGRRREVVAELADASRLRLGVQRADGPAGVLAVDDLADGAERAVEAEIVGDRLRRSPAASPRRCRPVRRGFDGARRDRATRRRRAASGRAPSSRQRAPAAPRREAAQDDETVLRRALDRVVPRAARHEEELPGRRLRELAA